MHYDKKSKLTAKSQESALHIPKKAFKNILGFLSPTEALKTATISKDNLSDFGPYIIQRLQNEKFKCNRIYTGYRENIAFYKDSSLYSWGDNEYGQLGLGYNRHQNTPHLINPDHFQNEKIKSIHIEEHHHTLALMDNGSLYAWGSNGYGQLGLGHTDNQNTPQLININHFKNEKIKSISLGQYSSFALSINGSLFSWGYTENGQLGLGHDEDPQNTPHLINPDHFQSEKIKSIHTGYECALALTTNGSIFSWGENEHGELGLGHYEDQYTPQLINQDRFDTKIIQSIYTEIDHILALSIDGSLYAWGYNERGELGLGNDENQNTPQHIDPAHFNNKPIQYIRTAPYHTLVLSIDGSLYAWGYNEHGELGLGNNENQNSPQLIDPSHFNNEPVQSIHTGSLHTLVLTTEGHLYSWGDNEYGQLGLGHYEGQYTPQLIDPAHFDNKIIQSICEGYFHNLVLMTDGSLYTWGANGSRQLGLGHTDIQNTPQKIEGRLEKAFRLGHENLASLSMFSNKSSEERRALKNRFLSQHVFMEGEINEVHAQRIPPGRQA